MKRISRHMILTVIPAILAGCSAKTGHAGEQPLPAPDSTSVAGVQYMQTSQSRKEMELKGRTYHIYIRRESTDSLPHVKNDMGDIYADNVITLRITRDRNEKVLEKTFVKQDFSGQVPGKLLKKCILEGMVFHKTSPQGMVLSASVSVPQTDLYVPISVTVSPGGKISLAKEEEMEDTYTAPAGE